MIPARADVPAGIRTTAPPLQLVMQASRGWQRKAAVVNLSNGPLKNRDASLF